MDRRLAIAPLLLLAGTALSGCVAVIPAVAGSAVFGSRVADRDGQSAPEAGPAPAVAPPAPAPAPSPTRVATPAPAPTPAPRTIVPPVPAAPTPIQRPAVASAPKVIAPPPVPVAAPTPAPAPVAAAPTSAAAGGALTAYPDPARPIPASHATFARFVRYVQAAAAQAKGGAELPSAVLSDPVALDGKRRRCAVGEQLVAVIDLDPAGGIFAPPATPTSNPGLAFGLTVLREAGVSIAWVSDLTTNQSGSLRTALEQSGLDPRGQDIISLSRDEADSKQRRKDNLAGITCIIAIAGDERPDFDMRYKYLRNPEASAGIDALIGDGWFMIQPLLGN